MTLMELRKAERTAWEKLDDLRGTPQEEKARNLWRIAARALCAHHATDDERDAAAAEMEQARMRRAVEA